MNNNYFLIEDMWQSSDILLGNPEVQEEQSEWYKTILNLRLNKNDSNN